MTNEQQAGIITETEANQPSLIKLSASSVKTYSQCPRKYMFRYIEHQPTKQFDHFDLGNLCHHSLEQFHKHYLTNKYTKASSAKVMSECFAAARLEYPDLPNELVLEAKAMLTEYLHTLHTNGMPKVISCEQAFEFEIAPEVWVRGYIDRIDTTSKGDYRIMDYKTTKSVQYLDSFQLLIYGLWLRKEHPEVTNFSGAYVLLRHKSKLKEYTFSIEDVLAAERKLIDYARTIRTENEWITIPSKLCNYCDFKGICPSQEAW
jgi:putative RecB family exonuclease